MVEVSDFAKTATIVSMLPYDLDDPKPGLLPAVFHVPACERGDFVVVPVTDCINHVDIGEGRMLTRMIPGAEVAGAIARDHISASIYTTADAYPAIHALPGNHTKEDIIKLFPELVAGMKQAQKNWFKELVQRADDTWNDPNNRGRSRAISDLQRYAATDLGLNREWLTAVTTTLVPCFACGFNIDSAALICMNCKTIVKPEEYSKATAGVQTKTVSK